MRAITLLVTAILGTALLGCDPFAFDDLSDEAPTRVLEAPDDYPRRGFGEVVHGYRGTLGGQSVSRFAATGGTNTPVLIYQGWDGDDFVAGSPLVDFCDDASECGDGAGAAVAGVPVWRAGSPDEGSVCLLITAPVDATYLVRCETGGGPTGGERFDGVAGQRFGASAASLGRDDPFGVAVVGAPDAPSGMGTGTLYRIPDGSAAVEIPFPSALVSDVMRAGGRLGESVAATHLPDGTTLVAAGAPGVGRVVVFALVDTGTRVEAEVRACLDDGSGGYGETLAFGDVNGDDLPDLFVGGGPRTEGRLEALHLYDGAALPDPGGACTGDDWGSEPTAITCPSGLRDGTVECTAAGFGGSAAVGDVDGDGFGDLVAGAPFADVDGNGDAGAVVVIPGGPGGLDLARADALTHSSPEGGDELGVSVSTVATHLGPSPRAEPVAGAPGRDAVMVFLCSGLTGDTQELGERCTAN